MSDQPVVKYTGSSTRRLVTKEQWAGAGVKGQKGVEWNTLNEYSVPIGEFSDEALTVLRRDKAFEIPDRPPVEDAVDADTQDAPPIVQEPPVDEGKARTARK